MATGSAAADAAKKGFPERIKRWVRGMRGEMKRVVWPSRKQVINNTGAVLAFMAVAAVVIGVFDMLLGELIRLAFGG